LTSAPCIFRINSLYIPHQRDWLVEGISLIPDHIALLTEQRLCCYWLVFLLPQVCVQEMMSSFLRAVHYSEKHA
jgi:hypothetical protein